MHKWEQMIVAELIDFGMICYTELLWQLLIDQATHALLPLTPSELAFNAIANLVLPPL